MKKPLVIALLCTATLASACGGPSSNGVAAKTPQQIINAAKSAARAASTVHIDGTLGAPGQLVTVDVRAKNTANTKAATGTIGISGAKLSVVRIGSTLYLKAPAAFFEKVASASAAAATKLLANKWIKTTTSNPTFSDIAALTDFTELFGGTLQVQGQLSKTTDATVRKQPAVKIGITNAFLYVATTGTPYPLELASTSMGTSPAGALYFEDWNDPVTVVAPAGAVDVDNNSEPAPSPSASASPGKP